MRGPAPKRWILGGAWSLWALLGAGCGSVGGTALDEGGEESGTGTGGPSQPPEPVDACEVASPLPPGRWEESLAEMDNEFGGACGNGGRDAFVRVRMDKRADLVVSAQGVAFSPIVSVHDETCIPGAERTYACESGLPLTVPDLAAGTELVVAIGIDPGDPALELGGEPDPLGFFVDLAVRHILLEGELCSPPERGRCVEGTACQADPETELMLCIDLPGDLCANALELELDGDAQVQVDPLRPWADDHVHGCTGERVRELVFRVALDEGLTQLPPQARLDVAVDAAGVGLALRAGSCLLDDELACTGPGPQGSLVEVPDLAALAAEGGDLWLFVELAQDPVPAPSEPFFVEFSVVDG